MVIPAGILPEKRLWERSRRKRAEVSGLATIRGAGWGGYGIAGVVERGVAHGEGRAMGRAGAGARW
jgi:hypothetical protein